MVSTVFRSSMCNVSRLGNNIRDVCFKNDIDHSLLNSHMFNVVHWIVGLYYFGFLVNKGMGLILVIQTFYPSTLSVLYNKDIYPTSSIV